MALISVRRHPARVAVVLALLALAVGVLFLTARGASSQPSAAAGSALSLRWTGQQDDLEIVAVGYRKREIAQVRVGSAAWRDVRADDNGTVRLTVPVDGAAAGTTVVVDGRAVAGGSRSLVSGVPPVVAARGPADLVPWLVAGVLVLIAAAAAFSHRRPAGGAQPDGPNHAGLPYGLNHAGLPDGLNHGGLPGEPGRACRAGSGTRGPRHAAPALELPGRWHPGAHRRPVGGGSPADTRPTGVMTTL
ncbi:hypothetical protein EV385_6329 [Krasilnikovia cinnamomea]|uniref:MYXO-CTERM domain-containing protein n=1 Tax=Krasilnikovia cinnamomea TaxID=349313 RepID=A0A4Q7ZT28_9ACTN|nr:hypothetical protein [Krasilnikovia cinnamomea]RZU54378.1 hypothetical protein EV385_6329 [Krasilnikovia cinnamomea]